MSEPRDREDRDVQLLGGISLAEGIVGMILYDNGGIEAFWDALNFVLGAGIIAVTFYYAAVILWIVLGWLWQKLRAS